ncbi:hypothetical protein HZA42_01040 [Candidatus Peregrinibacteria bacterium]|nr:hypothetical protein [Candidatus Peregrinibacteria bacterium]
MVFKMEDRNQPPKLPEEPMQKGPRLQTQYDPGVPASGRYIDVLMREAYEAMKKGQYQASAEIFEEILKKFKNEVKDSEKNIINCELGTLYFWLGDYESARRYCEDALSIKDDNDQAHVILGKVAMSRFHFSVARGHFNKISEDNPDKYIGLCFLAIKMRDTTGAEIFMNRAAGKLPQTDTELRICRAYFLLLKGDADFAGKEARAIMPKCEKDPFLLGIVGEILMTAGNYGEAIAAAHKILVVCKENDQALALLAHAAYAQENFSAAYNYADEAVRFNPLNAYAKTVLMKIATREGNYALAENIGTQILSDSPEYALGHANLGDVYFVQNRYELAEIEYEQTMELMNSDTKGARLRKARMKFIKEDYKGAAEILEELTKVYHTYYDDAVCDLLLCYEKLGNEQQKADLMDKAQMRRGFYHRTQQILQSFEE